MINLPRQYIIDIIVIGEIFLLSFKYGRYLINTTKQHNILIIVMGKCSFMKSTIPMGTIKRNVNKAMKHLLLVSELNLASTLFIHWPLARFIVVRIYKIFHMVGKSVN